MHDERVTLASSRSARRAGPPALLGLTARFVQRAFVVALEDDRIQALSLWGSLARGDGDEWSDVDLVATVPDDAVSSLIDDLSVEENLYGRSLVRLHTPQEGVEGGSHLAVTYLLAGFPLHVDWYLCPASLGHPAQDTKPLIAHDRSSADSAPPFAEFLRRWPSQQSSAPPTWDVIASEIPLQVKQVARGRPETVVVEGRPAANAIEAFEALGWMVSELPREYADVKPPLYNHVGTARQCVR